jgi:hypothetical protein
MAAELRRDRRERQKRQRQQRQRQSRRSSGIGRQLLVGAGVVAAFVLVVLGLRAAGVFEPPPAEIDVNAAQFQVPAGAQIGTLQEDEGRGHINVGQTATYKTDPPTSGDHWNSTSPAAPAPWGIKDATLPREVTVHNLEHGGIVIVYNKDTMSQQEIDLLKSTTRTLMNGAYRKIILEPYPLKDAKVALTAWRWLLKLQSVDQVQIVQFVRAHYADAKYAPEASAP